MNFFVRITSVYAIVAYYFAVQAVPSEDEITFLPGWNKGSLPSKQYSGYIDISGEEGTAPTTQMMVHYYYIESEGNPESDPLILWSNGGPGASSMFGLFTELGPLQTNENSYKTAAYNLTGVPTLFYNPNTWTKFSNVLMFDWPPPTGFSYCDNDPAGDGYSCGAWDDLRMAQVSYAALNGFFEKFPELLASTVSGGGLFLTGESYAGVYIPKLAQQILEHSMQESWGLKGIAVGDACAGTEVLCGDDSRFGPWFDYLFLYGHGQFSNLLWNDLMSYCGVAHLQYLDEPAVDSAACDAALSKVNTQVGGYYTYNLYDDCIYQNDFRRRRRLGAASARAASAGNNNNASHAENPSQLQKQQQELNDDQSTGVVGSALNDYVCGGGNAQADWANQPAVREAIHVPLNANFFSGDNAEGMVYDLTENNLMPFWTDMALDTDVRLLVYNGDTDPGINSFTAQNWTSHLGLLETEEWRPWTLDSCQRMGGYVTSYEGDFSFVTIRGSGHMVPTYKPEAAYSMMAAFVQGATLDPYVASCPAPADDDTVDTTDDATDRAQ